MNITLKKGTGLILLSALFLTVVSGCAREFQSATDIETSEKIVSQIDPSWNVSEHNLNGVRFYHIDAFSPDGRRVAYKVTTDDRKLFFVVDNTTGKVYDKAYGFVFSPDSNHFAYIAGDGEQLMVVTDGVEGKRYIGDISRPQFSPDSSKLSYVVETGDGSHTVTNGIDGRNHEWIVFDNQGVPGLFFSPDGKRVAYVAGEETDTGRKVFPVIDGIEGDRYDHMTASGIIFSPDSKRTAWRASIDDRRIIVIDGIEQPQEGTVIIFSPDSKDERTTPVVFSPDSKRIAYRVQTGEKWQIIVDGEAGKTYDYIDWPVYFSPDSKRLAYAAKNDNTWFMVVDGEESPPYRIVDNFVFSPDSEKYAYTARRSDLPGYFVVANGVEGKHYSHIYQPPVFSPDSSSLAYPVQNSGSEMMIINGVECKKYDHVMGGIMGTSLVFDSPDSLHYLAQSGNDIYLVRQTIR